MPNSTLKCTGCKEYFRRETMLSLPAGNFHSHDCAIAYGRSDKAQKALTKVKRADIRKRKEALKSRGDYVKTAQHAFNGFIRERDHYKPCISCGAHSLSRFGGGEDAGHYRSRGSAPHLALVVFNCHKQCKKCNRELSGNTVEYRARLIKRYGVKYVEAIEADQRPRKYNIEQLKRIAKLFRRRARHYKKLREKREMVAA